ncbi:MAG: hypothetical protein ACI8UD_003429 [Planctomycetota bacterium]|jgi:hypothetical protein
MNASATRLLTLSVGLVAATGLRAQFAEPFDSQALADVTLLSQPDTIVTFVDYSNMTIGAASFALPEAPRPIAGSLPTRGVLIQGNLTASVGAGVNILAGATPIAFSGRYRLSFDVWMNVPLPLPSGSTEQFLWGVGVDGLGPIEARNNRGTGTNGIWGWLCGDNDYGTEDAAINLGDIELADLGDLQPGENVPFNEAFDSNSLGGTNGNAANRWARVDIDVDAAGTSVFFNGVEFFNDPNIPVSGFAMIGYEDPFGSLGSAPDEQWGLLDNFRVTLPTGCGTAGTSIQQGTAAAGEILNGSALPAISAPLTLRLRGGPASSVAFLAGGLPAPFTLPVPINPNCTLNLELLTLDAVLGVPTDVDGGAIFTIDIPNNTAFCGSQLGWQYMWLDAANPACPFILTNGLTTTFGS